MISDNRNINSKKSGQTLFDYATELIGWILIVASPVLIGVLLGAIIYFSIPSSTTFTIAIVLCALGLIVGIIFASRIWKKQGTMQFISKIYATPDIEEKKY